MRRALLNAGDCITARHQKNGFRFRAALVTLTYRECGAWSGRHVSQYLKHCHKWMANRGHKLVYEWCAELQQRGAVHYHVVIWLPRGLTLPKPDKQGWWKHGSSRIEWARRPVGYLAKYVSKADGETAFPRGLRLHGRGGLELADRLKVSWWLLPRYQRDRSIPADRCVRASGGGWVSRDTGQFWPPWEPDPCPST
jgi:hypothetical protein